MVGCTPAALFMLGEWWAAEIVVLLSGKLPNAEQSLSAMNIFMETSALSFMLPLGLSIGIAIRQVPSCTSNPHHVSWRGPNL